MSLAPLAVNNVKLHLINRYFIVIFVLKMALNSEYLAADLSPDASAAALAIINNS